MRKPRILRAGATYHVTAKINRAEYIFEDEEFKTIFLNVVKRAKKKYQFKLKNFVIMGNHIHFLIEPEKNNSLSKIMQWILSVFASIYNSIKKISGHVWHGRFYSKTIDDIKQLFYTFNYISTNPERTENSKDSKYYKFGGLYYILHGIFDLVEKPEYDYSL